MSADLILDTAVPAVDGGVLEFARTCGLDLTPAQEAFLDAMDGGRPAFDRVELSGVAYRAGRRQLRAIVTAWSLARGQDVRLVGRSASEIGDAIDDVREILRAAPAAARANLTVTIKDEVGP